MRTEWIREGKKRGEFSVLSVKAHIIGHYSLYTTLLGMVQKIIRLSIPRPNYLGKN